MNVPSLPRTLPLEEAVHVAMLALDGVGPVWLRDGGDDVTRGGPGDGTALLWALLDLGAAEALLVGLVDPAAVTAAFAAGSDASLELSLGGVSGAGTGFPIDVYASVREIGEDAEAGRTVLLSCEGRYEHAVDVLVCERPIRQVTAELLSAHAIAPTEKRVIVVKGDVAPDLARLGQETILTATPGPTSPEPQP